MTALRDKVAENPETKFAPLLCQSTSGYGPICEACWSQEWKEEYAE